MKTQEFQYSSENMKESPFDAFMESGEEDFDLKEFLLKYLKYWPWFLGGLLISLFIGYLYLRYTPETYLFRGKDQNLKGRGQKCFKYE